MERDAKAGPVVRPDMLARITAQAGELLALKAKAAKFETALEEIGTEIRRLEEQTLPALMDEAGVAHLGLVDDLELDREEEIYASISKANAPAATAWLIKNNFGSIVKARITVEVERGDVAILEATRKALARAKVGYEESGGVNPATLKAFVREQLGKGKRLPKAITYHVQPRAVVHAAAAERLRPGSKGK
jgi:hypothetical protein